MPPLLGGLPVPREKTRQEENQGTTEKGKETRKTTCRSLGGQFKWPVEVVSSPLGRGHRLSQS